MNNMTFNLRDEQKYAPTYDRVADYVSSPLDFDWSKVSNKDAYRMRRMVRKSRANGVDMTTPENFFVKRSNPSDTYSGEIAQYTSPEYTTTYDGKEITGLYKQGGQTNYLNLFN